MILFQVDTNLLSADIKHLFLLSRSTSGVPFMNFGIINSETNTDTKLSQFKSESFTPDRSLAAQEIAGGFLRIDPREKLRTAYITRKWNLFAIKHLT